MIYYTYVETPIERLLLTSDGNSLVGVFMSDHKHGPQISQDWTRDDDALPFAEARVQLAEYFAGTRKTFELALKAIGTEFQKQVWSALRAIPYGETITYGELAQRIGSPNASRAVGLANGRNPLSIIVPCHRVIGSNGKLTGYAGGEARKQILLDMERRFGTSPVTVE